MREYEQRFGKTLDEDVKKSVILALAPSQVQNHCHWNSHILEIYAQVRTMLFDSCQEQSDTAAVMLYPWISRCWAKAKARKAKTTRKGKGNGKGKKSEISKDEKVKDEDKKVKGQGKANAKTTKHLLGYCLVCKAWELAKKDCWWNESAKSGKDTASLETPMTPVANTTTEPPITGMLIQSDEGETVPANPAQWLCSVATREPSREEFLIDSGAATSVYQQSLANSLGGKPRGLGVELRSATGHKFTTTANTTICSHTRDGVNVSGDFQFAPKDTGLQRFIISVGQVCDRGNIITFCSAGGGDTQRVHWQLHRV